MWSDCDTHCPVSLAHDLHPLPPPPVPTCPAMLCLRPPGKDDNPLTQKRKAAFDREPRKAQSVGGASHTSHRPARWEASTVGA